MGQIAYRANLSAATFPMTIADGGRTVIVPGPDQNFDRRVDPEGSQRDAGIPQALYMENVMPTTNGYQSVGYKTLAALPVPGPTSGGLGPAVVRGSAYLYVADAATGFVRRFLCLFRSQASFSNRDIVASSFTTGIFAWTYATGSMPFPVGEFLSSTRVRGATYVYSDAKFYTVDNPGTDVLNFTDITGSIVGITTLSDVVCIWSCANYLMVVLKSGLVMWSSLLTITDFTSSLVNGAGQIFPNDLNLRVKFVKEASNGFYIYTESEVIYGQYTGNARYPFKFTPVKDSGGYDFAYQVFGESRSSTQYAIDSTSNVRRIVGQQAELLASDVSNFLEKTKRAEELNYTTNLFSIGSVASTKKLTYLLDKYVITKHTVGSNSYFMTFDLGLGRYGKLKVQGDVYTDLQSLYFFGTEEGSVGYQLSFDIYDTDFPAASALLLGKFQYVRSRLMKLEEIEIEGPQNTAIVSSPNFSCALLPSTDGRNFDAPIPLSPTRISGGLVEYHCHNTARNHSLLLKGAFSVSTVQLKFVAAGDR